MNYEHKYPIYYSKYMKYKAKYLELRNSRSLTSDEESLTNSLNKTKYLNLKQTGMGNEYRTLHHDTPHDLQVLEPRISRGINKFQRQEAVFFTDNVDNAIEKDKVDEIGCMLKNIDQKGGSKDKILYTDFEIVDYPSIGYDVIESRLKKLYKICESDEDSFKPFIDPSKLIVGYNEKGIQGFMVLTETIEIYKKYPDGFEESGGLIGKSGLFITSVCGNIDKYYGLLNGLFGVLEKYCANNEIEYLLLHVSSNRVHIKNKYERYGFTSQGKLEQNDETFDIMRKII